MKYVITGHRGLIGESLKKRLDQEGHKCILAIDQKEGFNILDFELKELDLADTPDVLFHLAAQCKINEAIAKPILPHRNNADGTFHILEFCRINKIPKVVIMSTSRVLSPERNPYVASKIYVEELIKAYHDCYGIDYVIVRPSTVYGPCYDETSRLISNFVANAFRGEDLKIFGDENKTLDFTYVDDFVEGVMISMRQWNKSYNISGNNEVKIVDVADEVIKQTQSKSKKDFFPPEIAQPQKVNIDTAEIEALGYKPQIKIKEGIKRVVDWHKDNPEAWKNYTDKGEKYRLEILKSQSKNER
jgi:nucleoside-diphosphate-sugar epimerase